MSYMIEVWLYKEEHEKLIPQYISYCIFYLLFTVYKYQLLYFFPGTAQFIMFSLEAYYKLIAKS